MTIVLEVGPRGEDKDRRKDRLEEAGNFEVTISYSYCCS